MKLIYCSFVIVNVMTEILLGSFLLEKQRKTRVKTISEGINYEK